PKSTNLDIYSVSINGGAAQPEAIPGNGEATDNLPAYSPDNATLAWAAMERPGYERDRMVVKLLAKGEERPRVLTAAWDRSVGSIAWTADGEALIVTAQEKLDNPAFRIDIADGKVTRLTESGSVSNITPLKDGSIIYT